MGRIGQGDEHQPGPGVLGHVEEPFPHHVEEGADLVGGDRAGITHHHQVGGHAARPGELLDAHPHRHRKVLLRRSGRQPAQGPAEHGGGLGGAVLDEGAEVRQVDGAVAAAEPAGRHADGEEQLPQRVVELLGDPEPFGGGLAADGVVVADGDTEQIGQTVGGLTEPVHGVVAERAAVPQGRVDDGHDVAVGDDRHRRHPAERLHDGQIPEVRRDRRVGHIVGDEHRPAEGDDLAAQPLARAHPDPPQHRLVPSAGHAVHGEQPRLLPDGDARERHAHPRMERLGRLLGQHRGIDHVEDDGLPDGRQPVAPVRSCRPSQG